MAITTAATFCATLVDEWARAGVTDAVVCPGSRSTPLAVALASDARIAVHVHHDERRAAFMALGFGLATARPAVVLTTQWHRGGRAASRGGRGPPGAACRCSPAPPIARPSCTASGRRRRSIRPTSSADRCAGSATPGHRRRRSPRHVAVARGAGRRRGLGARPVRGRCTSTCRSATRSSATPGRCPAGRC